MSFLLFAADKVSGVVTSLGNKILGDKVKGIFLQRKMKRLVEDAVDRIVEQTDEYLRAEKADDSKKEILITCLCDKLQPLANEPQKFFAGDLDGKKLFDQCHPKGELPEAIRHEGMEQFYTVLFPQIAHFLAGSRVALAEWQAEGYREGFRRLSHLADEISGMSAKVTALPGSVVEAMQGAKEKKADGLLREFAQTLLNNLLLRLDLSPLRAERSLFGSLSDHFVVPQFRERKQNAKPVGQQEWILHRLCMPGARNVVHGGAGVGKTTCALWLQSCLLQASGSRLAVLIRLRGETNIESHSLLDLVKKQAGVHLGNALTDELLRGWHEAGKLVVILDGFDEVPEARRDGVEKWIKDLGASARQSSIIVTSRPLQSGHLEALPGPWQQWDLRPFDESRIVDFIQRWHRHLPEGELSPSERKVDAKALARTFFKDPSLKPLADTPLMLGTLLFVHHRDKKLPSGRVDLYERYIAAMLGLRDSGLGIEARATKLTDKQKRRVLAHISLHFHWNGLNEVNDDTMRRLVTEALEKFKFDETTDCLLPALCERTGLIQGPGAWSFMHKTIGEFLVAELICNGTTFLPNGTRLDRKELWDHRHEDTWTAVLFFWAGKTTPLELEKFSFELAEENGDDGPLLALALLGDQGERLEHDVRKKLAMKLLSGSWAPKEGNSNSLSISGTVPEAYYSENGVDSMRLRGLSDLHGVNVFSKLLREGVIPPEAIDIATPCHQSFLTISILWALGGTDSKLTLDVCDLLIRVPKPQLMLHTFFHYVGGYLHSQTNSLRIVEWLQRFPEGKSRLALLLIGGWSDGSRTAQDGDSIRSGDHHFGPVLWGCANYAVDDEWLKESFSWKSWSHDMRGDVLQEFYDRFVIGPPAAWDLGEKQHHDLIHWLKELLQRREFLRQHSSNGILVKQKLTLKQNPRRLRHKKPEIK
ncbi:MAG: NACHT domain-containing protein [Verrucomicrobiota bacterium]